MIKSFFISLLLISISSLDGFDITNNKFKIAHHLAKADDWGNLLVDGFEIDVKAAELAEKKLNGAYFDEKIHTIVPNDFIQTEKEWKHTKEKITQLIGPVPHSFWMDSPLWQNSSQTVDELLDDARAMAPHFKRDFQSIALQKEVIVNFGPSNEHIIKSKDSLISKMSRHMNTYEISEAEAISKIGDVLRGSIIVDKLEKIPEIISLIGDYADKRGAKVVFKNLWAEERESGYVGIHANLLLPVPPLDGKHYILAEMQIHLDTIMDGTGMSAKERAHLIYENVRSEQSSPAELSAASKLLFLTAMQEALEKIESKK